MTMLKGQIKSEIGDIQKEFNKIGRLYNWKNTCVWQKYWYPSNTDWR